MMIEGGYVKAYRKMMEWKWWSDSDTVKVFLYILFRANLRDGAFNGEVIPRGSFVTSRKTIAHDCYISEQTTRTILNRLKSTNEITIRTTSKYTVITVLNYDEYQNTNQVTNQQLTNNQPTTNQQLTTEEEYKEYKECKEDIIEKPSASKSRKRTLSDDQIDELINAKHFSERMKEQIRGWCKYHREIGKPYKSETGFKGLLTKIENGIKAYGEDVAIVTFEDSMANNYEGLFFESTAKKMKGGNTNGSSKRDSPDKGADGDRKEPVYGSYEWYRSVGYKES